MDDAEAREDRATLTSRGDAQEPADGDQPDRSGFAGGEPDADAVVIAEVTEVRAGDDPAGQEPAAPLDANEAEPADTDPGAVPAEVVPAEVTRPGSSATAAAEAARHAAPADGDVPDTGMLGDPEQLYQRWSVIQASFVDDPRGSVTAAAELLTETIGTLVASAQERERGLRGEWDREGTDTEGLRNALRGYRRFLDQLAAR